MLPGGSWRRPLSCRLHSIDPLLSADATHCRAGARRPARRQPAANDCPETAAMHPSLPVRYAYPTDCQRYVPKAAVRSHSQCTGGWFGTHPAPMRSQWNKSCRLPADCGTSASGAAPSTDQTPAQLAAVPHPIHGIPPPAAPLAAPPSTR